jgi:quercetin dioxygenase-like cupin family protein
MRIVRYKDIPDERRGGGAYSIKRLLTQPLTKSPKNVGYYQTTIPAGSKVTRHNHLTLEETLIFLTKSRVKIKGEMYYFEPKDMVFLEAGEDHEIYADNVVVLIAVKLPDNKEDKIIYNRSLEKLKLR